MRHPPAAAVHCPVEHIVGVLHRLENLTKVRFCRFCYALNNICHCAVRASQTPGSYRDQPLWSPPAPTYASMASSVMTLTTPLPGSASSSSGPPPGFAPLGMPPLVDVLPPDLGYDLLRYADVGRGLGPHGTAAPVRPQAPGTTGIRQV